MKVITIGLILFSSAFLIFPVGILTLWVFGGMYVPEDLHERAVASFLFAVISLPPSIIAYLEFED